MRGFRKPDLSKCSAKVRSQLEPYFSNDPKKGKYSAKRAGAPNFREIAGRSFHSQLERDRAVLLVLLQRAKQITGLRFQPSYRLGPDRFRYHADFEYTDLADGILYAEDTKGFAPQGGRWSMIKRMWRKHGPMPLRVTVRADSGKIILKTTIEGEANDESI